MGMKMGVKNEEKKTVVPTANRLPAIPFAYNVYSVLGAKNVYCRRAAVASRLHQE